MGIVLSAGITPIKICMGSASAMMGTMGMTVDHSAISITAHVRVYARGIGAQAQIEMTASSVQTTLIATTITTAHVMKGSPEPTALSSWGIQALVTLGV
jgi:hypothetical protein